MTKDFIEAAKVWAAGQKDVLAYTTQLVEGGINAAVFSSVVRAIAGIAVDAPPYVHGDVDLLIFRKHLAPAARLLPQVKSNWYKVFRTRSTDGVHLFFAAHEITGLAGREEVQFVAPHTPVIGPGHSYDTVFSADAHSHSTVIETDNGLLPIAHLAFTAGMYGILQRPADGEKMSTILQATDVMGDPYSAVVAETMGWDARVYDFLGAASISAIAGGRQEPLLVAAIA